MRIKLFHICIYVLAVSVILATIFVFFKLEVRLAIMNTKIELLDERLAILTQESEQRVTDANDELSKLQKEAQEAKVSQSKEITQLKKEVASIEQEIPLANIINQWKDRVGEISCAFRDGSIRGTSFVTRNGSNEVIFLTNKHITQDRQGITTQGCTMSLNGQVYSSGDFVWLWDDLDLAYVKPMQSSTTLLNISKKPFEVCQSPKVGETLVVLGYPAIGSGLTATEGILSGYDGDFYSTSAKIDSGNSGGIAVLAQKECLLGVPTLTSLGIAESLGRILNLNLVTY